MTGWYRSFQRRAEARRRGDQGAAGGGIVGGGLQAGPEYLSHEAESLGSDGVDERLAVAREQTRRDADDGRAHAVGGAGARDGAVSDEGGDGRRAETCPGVSILNFVTRTGVA
jgi:hypothetical protein